MRLFSLSNCVYCGSFFPKSKLLCRVCEGNLLGSEFFGIKVEQIEEIRLISLFDWVPERSDSLSVTFLALKGTRQQEAWQSWAEAFWAELGCDYKSDVPLYFFAAPGSVRRPDHAAFFGQALAILAGGTWLGSLEKEQSSHQRGRGKLQRSRMKVRTPVNIPRGRIVLVDDIFTTGATARACFLALGKPRDFQIWTLGKRTLACEEIGELL